jgi:hypothetical protein
VRALPAAGEDGRAFQGPGFDLRGDDARRVFEAAAPLLAWIQAREPGARVRSLSLEVSRARVLVTLAGAPGERPRVVRVDPPASIELVEGARAVLSHLGEVGIEVLRRRRGG